MSLREKWETFCGEAEAFLRDMRYFRLFPRHYKGATGPVPKEQKEKWRYWSEQAHGYYNFRKRVAYSGCRWYVLTYKDGHKELAYLRVWYVIMPKVGRLCRGIVPRLWSVFDYEHVESIRIAF